jgi:hypothetical protein
MDVQVYSGWVPALSGAIPLASDRGNFRIESRKRYYSGMQNPSQSVTLQLRKFTYPWSHVPATVSFSDSQEDLRINHLLQRLTNLPLPIINNPARSAQKSHPPSQPLTKCFAKVAGLIACRQGIIVFCRCCISFASINAVNRWERRGTHLATWGIERARRCVAQEGRY